jgi:subtilase family serine protease
MRLIKGRHHARQASRPARARTRSSPWCDYLEPRCLLSTGAPANLSNIMATPAAVLYAPGQIRTAYRVNSLPNQFQGAGETIAIVDAYSDPKIVSDLATADAYAGIPAPPSFTIINQNGATSPLPRGNTSWGVEISLDVEWAHSIAPAANLLLVEANSSSLADLLKAVDTAANYTGVAAVSMSWGSSEFSNESSYDSNFTTPGGHTGVTFVASSGDSGGVVEWPAASPNVLSVGGTTLSLNSDNTWKSETAWSGSGGGVSRYESSPSYQSGMGYSKRATPDVSYDANPNSGFDIYDTYGYGGVMGVGGTSAGAPQWAALVAIFDEMAGHNLDGASQTLPAVYSVAQSAYSSNFHDITSGTAGRNSAGKGFDLVTGWGSPIANSIVPTLAASASASAVAPATAAVVSPAPTTPPSTPGHRHDVTVIQVPPVASSVQLQTVTIGIAALSGPTVNPAGVPTHSSSVSTSVSSFAASPTATGGPSSSTTAAIGLGQDLVGGALTPSSTSQITQPADWNPEAAEIGRQTTELESTHVPAVPELPGALAPAVPGGDNGQSRVTENLKRAGKEKGEDAKALPGSVIPPQSRLDPLGDESPSETRSNRDAAWGVCLMVGATAALWNSRGISGRQDDSRRLHRISTHV